VVAKVTTGQIYRGAIPFIAVQLLMVLMVLAAPALVTLYKVSPAAAIDPSQVKIEIQGNDLGSSGPYK
jgi:hypothetical protein